MTTPTTCWVIVHNDTKGKPRGFEKSNERFYLAEWEAREAHEAHEFHDHSTNVECVIMAATEYDAMVKEIGVRNAVADGLAEEVALLRREVRELRARINYSKGS